MEVAVDSFLELGVPVASFSDPGDAIGDWQRGCPLSFGQLKNGPEFFPHLGRGIRLRRVGASACWDLRRPSFFFVSEKINGLKIIVDFSSRMFVLLIDF